MGIPEVLEYSDGERGGKTHWPLPVSMFQITVQAPSALKLALVLILILLIYLKLEALTGKNKENY